MSRRIAPELREQVRRRAGARCEYCRKPDSAGVYAPHVDHIIPPMHGGKDEPDNYAWACFQCNSAKSGQIASYDFETQALTVLFDPRLQQWSDHFALEGSVIVGRTETGRVTVRILQMNSPLQVETRAELLAAGIW